jgi:hypothetical protein
MHVRGGQNRVVHGSGRPAGRVGLGRAGSNRVEIFRNFGESGRVEIFEISGFFGLFRRVCSSRVGSSFLQRIGGSGRVGSGIWWVGSGLEKWTHGQLWDKMFTKFHVFKHLSLLSIKYRTRVSIDSKIFLLLCQYFTCWMQA